VGDYWKLTSKNLIIHDTEDGSLVYHEGTGNTHLVSFDAANILRLLSQHNALPIDEIKLKSANYISPDSVQNLVIILNSLQEVFLIETGNN